MEEPRDAVDLLGQVRGRSGRQGQDKQGEQALRHAGSTAENAVFDAPSQGTVQRL